MSKQIPKVQRVFDFSKKRIVLKVKAPLGTNMTEGKRQALDLFTQFAATNNLVIKGGLDDIKTNKSDSTYRITAEEEKEEES